ncbi:DUF6978 family protein [Sedimenticola hydrogenitrophicus]|uniref:DUF6978 family protein n=1 Tax=Sedimenticola hydrogenitrophicus TaxID=2967975 RepID=UPI0021A2BFF6|nr:hypothetical protein [Sedimenticola hydrogenitrophicus]
MSLLLTQQEADALLALEKHYLESDRFSFPSLGGNLRIPLHSADHREEFSLDITRGKIELRKNTFQARGRKAVILARIDIGGPPHRNPDGEEIGCPHLHVYREGYGDKWATPLPETFANHEDAWTTLLEFMDFCNVSTKPTIMQELFT